MPTLAPCELLLATSPTTRLTCPGLIEADGPQPTCRDGVWFWLAGGWGQCVLSSPQIQKWGNVEWAHDYELQELRARTAAGILFVHLCSESTTVKHKLLQE